MKSLVLILLALPLAAGVTVEVTATQAVISYTAPDATACTIDVHESGAASVVHDVDASLFTGANLDSRSTSVNNGTFRKIVVGKRAAELALDAHWYSRPLQANTLHVLDLTCGGGVHITGSFTTMNIPLGMTHASALPVNPSSAGNYAWPEFPSRNTPVVDPQTGILLRLLDPAYNFTFDSDTGDTNQRKNCSRQMALNTVTGEMGWHCVDNHVALWIGVTTGTVNRLAALVPPFVQGVDNVSVGWNSGGDSCWDTYWDPNAANVLFCQVANNALPAGHYILKLVYSGDNGDANASSVIACGSAPCWTAGVIGTTSLESALQAFMPEWTSSRYKSASVALVGTTGTGNSLLLISRRWDHQNAYGVMFLLDKTSGAVVASKSSWQNFPARFACLHGPFNSNDPTYVASPETACRGSYTAPGTGDVGDGPYLATMVGTLSSTPGACPAYVAGIIPLLDWPTGNHCSTVTMDGEPGDPSPGFYSTGTITVAGANITGSGTSWTSSMDQGVLVTAGASRCRASVVDATHITTSACVGTLASGTYTLYLEEAYSGRTGNPLAAYLVDAAPNDRACITTSGGDPATSCGAAVLAGQGYYTSGADGEVIRILTKSGNTWVIERGFTGSSASHTLSTSGVNPQFWMMPGSSIFAPTSIGADPRTIWNYVLDPTGTNVTGTTVVNDPQDVNGCCHGTHIRIHANRLLAGIARTDDSQASYYYSRFSSYPAAFTDPGFAVSSNPLFHGLAGIGNPNGVDTHPTATQFAATDNEKRWIGDYRPSLGDNLFNSDATLVTGQLWKFAASSPVRLRRRVFSTMATSGSNILKDVSGLGNIASDSSGNFTYCVVIAVNGCWSGSVAGEVYFNVPSLATPRCIATAIGAHPVEAADICIADQGAYTLANVQVGADRPDIDGAYGRRITAIGQYRLVSEFGNNGLTPDGKYMFIHVRGRGAVADYSLLATLPPFPAGDNINRADFIPIAVKIPTIAGANNVIVKFGYDTAYSCTSRTEACVANAATIPTGVTPFAYTSESPSGLACASGCTVMIPALSQRAIYFVVQIRDGSNAVIQTLGPDVRGVR